jgi:hypothetical protein
MSFEKTVKLACKPKNAPPKSKVRFFGFFGTLGPRTKAEDLFVTISVYG